MLQPNFGRHQDWDPSRKIYIRGLRSDSNKQQMMEAFASFGKVLAVWIAQKPPGYAFLLMESSSDARDSCVGLNNTRIGGYKMQVQMATGSVKGERTSDLEERSSDGRKSRLRSRTKRSRSTSRRSSPSRRSRHSRKEGEIEGKVPSRRPGITERGSHGRRRRKEGSRSRNGKERMRNRSKSYSASRRVVMVQHPLKFEGVAENEGKQDRLAVLIKNGVVDNVNNVIMGELGDTELDYEPSNDEVRGVVIGDEKMSEPGNSMNERIKVLELEKMNGYIEIDNRNLKLRNEELLRENIYLAEEERYLRFEKKTLERANQDLKREVEDVKWENDHLKQKNTQLVEGMLQLRARLHGAVEVVDAMEVLRDEVLKTTPKRERGDGQ